MKYLILSDIHGGLVALEQVLETTKDWDYDRILILGDVLNHGPRNPLPEGYNPPKVSEQLNSLKSRIIAIKGNCDSEVDGMLLQFPIVSQVNIIPFKKRNIIMTHGHEWTPEKISSMSSEDIYVSGHTHIPVAKKTTAGYLFNPGSISLPKENHPPTFGMIDKKALTVYTLDGESYMTVELD